MAVNYYYLIPGIPTLKTDGEMPITYDAFLKMCRPSVSISVYKALSELSTASMRHFTGTSCRQNLQVCAVFLKRKES